MSGPIFSGDTIPENLPKKTKKWLENNKPLWKTSPFDIPGPRYVKGIEGLDELMDEYSRKFDVDRESIFLGRSKIPPTDPACLVYLNIIGSDCCTFFRKELKPEGRWICESYMHHIKGSPEQEGTFDYRYGIAYF
ncbi:MAG: hypothetical protein E7K23_10870 [Lachnospiraceae bacterium]|nr:hypothetical protein [Clostridiales bacterium]MDU7632853.1 hypothetical protein [Lachnospiraceae bacterium]DAI14092.1 MAG TPA: hypothetical protein [Caudoviricetes sp.]